MSYIALYQGTASEAAEKVRKADSSWAEAHSECQEERTCTAHLKVRPFKTHGKCLFQQPLKPCPFKASQAHVTHALAVAGAAQVSLEARTRLLCLHRPHPVCGP